MIRASTLPVALLLAGIVAVACDADLAGFVNRLPATGTAEATSTVARFSRRLLLEGGKTGDGVARAAARMLAVASLNTSQAPAPSSDVTVSPVPVATPISLPPPPPPPAAGQSFCSQHMCNAWWIGFLGGTFLLFICIYLASAGRPFACLANRRRRRYYPGIRPFAGVAIGTSRSSNSMMRPVPVSHPGDGKQEQQAPWECPVCMEEITEGPEWTIFPCEHGSCNGCYQKLLSDSPFCPLCRIQLTEPDPEKMKAWRQVSTDGRIPNRRSRDGDASARSGAADQEVPQHIVVIPLQDDCAEPRADQTQASPSSSSPSSSHSGSSSPDCKTAAARESDQEGSDEFSRNEEGPATPDRPRSPPRPDRQGDSH